MLLHLGVTWCCARALVGDVGRAGGSIGCILSPPFMILYPQFVSSLVNGVTHAWGPRREMAWAWAGATLMFTVWMDLVAVIDLASGAPPPTARRVSVFGVGLLSIAALATVVMFAWGDALTPRDAPIPLRRWMMPWVLVFAMAGLLELALHARLRPPRAAEAAVA